MFLSLDGTVVIQLINFVIFFALLNIVFLRPVGAAIKRRREYINGVQSGYERYAREAAGLRASANERRAAARRFFMCLASPLSNAPLAQATN